MITRTVRIQLLAFAIITVVGVSYVGLRYADADRLLGSTTYPVKVELADSGGIFTGADVTYRGVSVGRVGPLRLTEDGVTAQLDIDDDAPAIPSDVDVKIANLSAIGEQYVDLRPRRADGPKLKSGSVISKDRTTVPVPVEQVIVSLDRFTRSVPLDALRTVVNELGAGFANTGPALQTIIDSTAAVTEDALAALPETLALINDGRTVLETQNRQSSEITSFSRDLALLAEQLRTSDPDLRRLIGTAPQLGTQTIALLQESAAPISRIIADLLTTARVALPRQAGLRQVLVTFPGVLTGAYSAIPGDESVHFGLQLNVFDPFPCTRGYEGTQMRSGDDLTPIEPNVQAHCGESPGSEITVRGNQNVPRAGAVAPPATPSSGGVSASTPTVVENSSDFAAILRGPVQ